MSKPFNIHDWQAKQRQQRLEEIRAQDVPGTAAWRGRAGLTVGGSYATDDTLRDKVSKYIGQTFASWMSPDNPPFSQEYAKSPYIDKLVDGIMGIVDKGNVEEHHAGEYKKGFLEKTVNSFLDDLKKKSETDYDKVEDIIEKHFSMDENMTGGGTFITGDGSSEAGQTGGGARGMNPKAFKKKNDDEK